MWIPCWLRRLPLLVLVSIHVTSFSLLAQDEAPVTEASEVVETESADDHDDDSDWAVDLSPSQFPDRPDQAWELPELTTPAWNPNSTDDEVRPDGSSLAEQASVVNSLASSAEIDTSMHTFYAVMAVLGLIAGGICCLQLSR